MLQQGVIYPSVSEWSAAPVIVHKKTGELRYCIDVRALNSKRYKDNFSLLLINYCMDSLYGKKLSCVFDLCSCTFRFPWKKVLGIRHHSIRVLAAFSGLISRWACVLVFQAECVSPLHCASCTWDFVLTACRRGTWSTFMAWSTCMVCSCAREPCGSRSWWCHTTLN